MAFQLYFTSTKITQFWANDTSRDESFTSSGVYSVVVKTHQNTRILILNAQHKFVVIRLIMCIAPRFIRTWNTRLVGWSLIWELCVFEIYLITFRSVKDDTIIQWTHPFLSVCSLLVFLIAYILNRILRLKNKTQPVWSNGWNSLSNI